MDNLYNKIYNAINNGLQNVLVIDDGDSPVNYQKSVASNDVISYAYRFVDMGTGILWAEYNLGAFPGDKAEDWFGDYYAWGEIMPKPKYTWENYIHCNGTEKWLTKYNCVAKCGFKDNLRQLEKEDDAAYKILGEKFRIPMPKDYEKLIDITTQEYIENYKGIHGLSGSLFTAKNGNTLFFPAAGYYCDDGYNNNNIIFGYNGSIWTAKTRAGIVPIAATFEISNEVQLGHNSWAKRYCGMPIRAVCDKK